MEDILVFGEKDIYPNEPRLEVDYGSTLIFGVVVNTTFIDKFYKHKCYNLMGFVGKQWDFSKVKSHNPIVQTFLTPTNTTCFIVSSSSNSNRLE